MTKTVIGVDGCRAGWIAVIWEGNHLRTELFQQFSEILRERAAIIAIDMPIGFRDGTARSAESEARKFIGKRAPSVFTVASRSTVEGVVPFSQELYALAKSINAATTVPSRKISKQAFNLIPKMQDIDRVVDVKSQYFVFEAHPEVSFCAMNENKPLRHGKKSEAGTCERLNLLGLQKNYPSVTEEMFGRRRKDVGRDDVIDACACAWSARRILDGNARHFPEAEERDAHGLLMRIHA